MRFSTRLLKPLLAAGLTLTMSAISLTAQAAVTLLVDDNIKVTAVNGQEVKQSAFQPLKKQFTLQPGKHVITAKYDRLYDLRHDEHDYLRSANVSVAAELQDNQTYRLVMPNQPEDYQQAKEYAKNPTLAIKQDSVIIAKQTSIDANSGGLFSGITSAIGGMLGGGQGSAQQSNQQAIAALEQPSSSSQSTSASSAASNTSSATNSNASTLDKFMQLWLQASPAEREKIRQWVTE